MPRTIDYARLYRGFHAPIAALNCGDKCSPYNENGVPFCCDNRHAVPTAYDQEWDYLRENTDLWQPWHSDDPLEMDGLKKETPPGQVLIGCQGADKCQRNFRAITCRAFPFYPYINGQGEFIGLSYYWEYADRCWVISNLKVVSATYRAEFVATYDQIFEAMPEELETFSYHSAMTRRGFARQRRTIPLLHRNGLAYKISPASERLRQVPVDSLPKFEPYALADMLPFPDELPGYQPASAASAP